MIKHMWGTGRTLAGLVVVAVIGITAPADTAAAVAQPTCTFDPQTATVTLSISGGYTGVQVKNGAIYYQGPYHAFPCGAATVTNTNVVRILTGAADDGVIIDGPERFTPGAGLDTTGTPTIKFEVDMQATAYFLVENQGGGRHTYTAGPRGLAFDADTDLDLTFTAATPEVNASCQKGRCRLSGDGGHGTGGVDPNAVDFYSGAAGAVLTGGNGDDQFAIGSGIVNGGGGNDTMALDTPSNDVVFNGGDGSDTVDLGNVFGSMVYSSLDGVADDGPAGNRTNNYMPDVENVLGSPDPDTIVGSSARNVLYGAQGDDTITGGPGRDRLSGAAGNDTFFAQDGEADQVYGSKGDDTATVDCLLDDLRDIDTIIC